MELILDHLYDLSKPVYLVHPQNKFWEVKLDANNVIFRVGKIKGKVESGEEIVEKDYPTPAAAKASVLSKII